MSYSMRLVAALMALPVLAPSAALADLDVPMDEVRIMRFGTPVKTVFVGNPLIADVTVIDTNRIFVLGKNFGSTNIIVLDADGDQIANERVTVQGSSAQTVTLQRGNSVTTLACGGERCNAIAVPGDENSSEPFGAVSEQVRAREELLKAASGVALPGGGGTSTSNSEAPVPSAALPSSSIN